MAKWFNCLAKWRSDRALISPSDKYVCMMLEEIVDELVPATLEFDTHEIVDAWADQIILTENQACLEQISLDHDKQLSGTSDDVLSILNNEYRFESEDNSIELQAIYSICNYNLAQLGYNTELVLKLVCKHISSRRQDANQARRWKLNPELCKSEKWSKDRNQNPSTIYQPDYSTCKLKQK